MEEPMVSGWELRLGGPNPRVKFTELSGVGDDLDRERRKKGARKQPVQQQSQPSRPLHGLGKSTAQAHWTLLAPVFDPLTTVSRRHSKTRPPSTTKARHPAFESQLHEYVDQQENDVTPVQEPHYPFPDPGACPPPIADPQPAAPMGHAGRATLPFYINGSTMDLHGTYTRSRLHSTVSRALGSLTRGGIHPKPPPGPGDQALMSLILDVNTKGKGNYKHLDFFAHIDDRLEGYNFCIGSREWNQIIAERPDYGLSPAASVPAGSSSFDLVDPGGPAAAVRADITPAPSAMYGDENHHTAHTHVGMDTSMAQLPDGGFGNDMLTLMDNNVVFPYATPGSQPFSSSTGGGMGDGSFSQQLNASSTDASFFAFSDVGAAAYGHSQGYSPDVVDLDESVIRLNADPPW